MNNIKILPCPCCNSEIKGGVRLTGYCNSNTQYIQCDCCGLKIEIKYIIDDISQSELKNITKELIEKWNTRKSIDNIIERLKEVPTEYNHEEYNQAIYDVIKYLNQQKEVAADE